MTQHENPKPEYLRPPKDETLELAYRGLVISLTSTGKNKITREQAEAMLASWETEASDQ